MKKQSKIPKQIEVMLYAQRWCGENDIEFYTKEITRVFVVIRQNNEIYELELSQTEIELRAEEKDPMFFIKKTNGSGTDYPFDQLGDADSELTIVSGT